VARSDWWFCARWHRSRGRARFVRGDEQRRLYCVRPVRNHVLFDCVAPMDRGNRPEDANAKIIQTSFGRWTATVVDCPLDRCRQLGRIEYETDGSYGVYVELSDGTRHAIPLKDSSFEEAGRVASQLSDATGITRRDTKF
jgi:hypothetical protein